MLVGGLVLMVGCNNGAFTEITPRCEILDIRSIPLEIIHLLVERFYRPGTYNVISRWKCGVVYVYDETKYEKTDEILQIANDLIQGPVVFRTTKDPNKAKVKIVFFNPQQYLPEVPLPLTSLPQAQGEEVLSVARMNPDIYDMLDCIIYISQSQLPSYNHYFERILRGIFFACIFLTSQEKDLLKQGIMPESLKKVIWYSYRLPLGTKVDPLWELGIF